MDTAVAEEGKMSEVIEMIPPATEDIERRRRVWILCASPLFDFWLDEEPSEDDFLRIARVAKEVGYAQNDLKRIYWKEVVPAVMGTWFGLDPMPAWLEQRILHRPRLGYWLSWLLRPWWGWVAWDCWRKIKKHSRVEWGLTEPKAWWD
jgi:hypothetical protein